MQKIKEEVTAPKTAKRVRESPALESDEPEKTAPKRPKTQVKEGHKKTGKFLHRETPVWDSNLLSALQQGYQLHHLAAKKIKYLIIIIHSK